jgi:predicted secreted protein
MAVRPPSRLVLVVVLMVAASLAGCGPTDGPAPKLTPPPGTSSPTSSVASTLTPTRVSTTAGSTTVTATEEDNGRTVRLRQGQQLHVVLHSTYWTMKPVTQSQVLSAGGDPVISPQPSGCVAGGGCGTVTARYDAVAPGRTEVTATRTSCGEAMGCTAADATWMVAVLVE